MARVDFNTVEKDDNKDLYDSPGNDLHIHCEEIDNLSVRSKLN